MTNHVATADSLPLQRMSQQQLAHSSTDDWTGITDQARRRKLQNRLNQRAYRTASILATHLTRIFQCTDHLVLFQGSRMQASNGGGDRRLDTPTPHAQPGSTTDQPQGSGGPPQSTINSQISSFRCGLAPDSAGQFMAAFEGLALEHHRQGSPNLDHLVTLSRVNVQRALMENILAVGMNMEWMIEDDAISLFNLAGPSISTDRIPSSLHPTAIQRSIPHHPWFDVFPFPNMRDNLITASDSFDDEELCRDLMGFWDTRDSRATLLVWGSPHDPRNWEVTAAFLAKWGWLLSGCPEIFVSTNQWRAQRGERPLVRRGMRLGAG